MFMVLPKCLVRTRKLRKRVGRKKGVEREEGGEKGGKRVGEERRDWRGHGRAAVGREGG